MRVKDLMTHSPCTCSVHDTANVPAQHMWEHDCGIVPVVSDDGRLVGVVTDRDICMAAYLQGSRLSEIPVEAFMTRELTACRPEDTLQDAEHMMQMRQVHRLPVVDERGAPVGVLSLADLAKKMPIGNGRGQNNPVEQFVETVATISRPRAGGDPVTR
jgi:CBS domain-containing protein